MSAQGSRLDAELLVAGGSSQLESAGATSRSVTRQLVTKVGAAVIGVTRGCRHGLQLEDQFGTDSCPFACCCLQGPTPFDTILQVSLRTTRTTTSLSDRAASGCVCAIRGEVWGGGQGHARRHRGLVVTT